MWSPGTKIESPVNEMVEVRPDEVDPVTMYKLLIGAIVPRPIAFVSTIDKEGRGNLAPFSFFNGVCSNPPSLMISIARNSDGTKKDTLRNIEETGQFVVNSANRWLIDPLVHSAGAFPHGVDEMAVTGLTPLPSVCVKPPRVKESSVQFECETLNLVGVGDGSPGSSTVVIGKIIRAHIAKECYRDGRIDVEILSPVGRLGGINYCTPGDIFGMPIPKVGEK